MRSRRVEKIIVSVFATVLAVVTTLVAFLFAAAFYLNHTSEPPPTYILQSNEPYQTVHVPFQLRDGIIYLPMFISGWKMEGRLDTGGFDMVWNKDEPLHGARPTGRTRTIMDFGHNKINRAKQVVIRSVDFGNYHVHGLVSYAVDTKANPKSMVGDAVKQTPLVGNEAFCGCVLTIDYYKKEIIVRNASYDCAQTPRAANAIVLPFHRRPSKTKNYYGAPIVWANINGVPAEMRIDTGVSGHICLNEAFAAKLPTSKGAANTDNCGNVSYFYPPVPVAFEPLVQKETPEWAIPPQVYPNVKQGADASVGYDLLRFFRVTIDYPRQRILLEPYGEDKVRILPKGSIYTVQQADNKLLKTRLTHDEVLCRHADGTNTITP